MEDCVWEERERERRGVEVPGVREHVDQDR